MSLSLSSLSLPLKNVPLPSKNTSNHPLYCNMIPCLFQSYLLFTSIYFSIVLFQAFRFLRPVKGLRISLRPSGIFDMFSLYLLLTSIVNYTSLHFVKSVQIRSFFWPVFFRIWTEYWPKMAASNHSFQQFVFGCLFTIVKKNNDLSVKKMFIEIKCNRMTYAFKGHVNIVKIYMVKFNVSVLKWLKIMVFLSNTEHIHKYNVILNKTVTKLVTILTKGFFFHI